MIKKNLGIKAIFHKLAFKRIKHQIDLIFKVQEVLNLIQK